MAVLTLRREFEFPSFGAGKWTKADHDRPLRLQLSVAKALIFLEEDRYTKSDLIVFPQGRIELIYDPAPERVLKGMKSKGPSSAIAAQTVYDAYVEAHSKLVSLLYSPGQLRYVHLASPAAIQNFFSNSMTILGRGVEWKLNSGSYQPFNPRLPKPKGRNPIFKADQLLTPARWSSIQKAADVGDFLEGDLLELYRIRGKAAWRELRVAAIEASIISESLLRSYGIAVLKKNGFSGSKLKRLKDEMTFNNLLNILLPLSLSKTELRSMQANIESVDVLRGIRNALVHGNMEERDIDGKQVDKGIEGAIKLVRFLRDRI